MAEFSSFLEINSNFLSLCLVLNSSCIAFNRRKIFTSFLIKVMDKKPLRISIAVSSIKIMKNSLLVDITFMSREKFHYIRLYVLNPNHEK